MKITIAQLNPTIGDIKGNLQKAMKAMSQAKEDSSDLVVFPELFLTGYPPRDLLEKPYFIEESQEAINRLVRDSINYPDLGIIFGTPLPTGKNTGKGLYNSAVLVYQGKIIMSQHKSLLPTYDVFDEARYFDVVSEKNVIRFKDEVLGISICEDAWNDPKLSLKQNYLFDPIKALAEKNATIFINISASPFHIGKEELRYRIIQNHARRYQIPFVFVNQIGGNDELIFDGRSFYLDKNGEPIKILPSFKEHVTTVDVKLPGKKNSYVFQNKIESVYQALVLGIRDYMRKCGFSKAILGLSGGIDSAVVCCLAKEAVGSKNVMAVSMPSPYSSEGSVVDSRKLAERLGVEFKVIPISSIYSSYTKELKEHLKKKEMSVTEENIQARIRGNILMALSNEFGYLVLSTGNKSELAVGYCTLYGDMSGGLDVLSDVLKTMVYELACYLNRESEIIPKETIEKAPSAELRPDQKDQDSLPPYDILDGILHWYLDEGYSVEKIINLNFNPETVEWVVRAVDKNEYKRRQAAPGLKVTTKAFGVGRRMPIAAKYRV